MSRITLIFTYLVLGLAAFVAGFWIGASGEGPVVTVVEGKEEGTDPVTIVSRVEEDGTEVEDKEPLAPDGGLEIEKLREENARLQAELKEFVDPDPPDYHYGDLYRTVTAFFMDKKTDPLEILRFMDEVAARFHATNGVLGETAMKEPVRVTELECAVEGCPATMELKRNYRKGYTLTFQIPDEIYKNRKFDRENTAVIVDFRARSDDPMRYELQIELRADKLPGWGSRLFRFYELTPDKIRFSKGLYTGEKGLLSKLFSTDGELSDLLEQFKLTLPEESLQNILDRFGEKYSHWE